MSNTIQDDPYAQVVREFDRILGKAHHEESPKTKKDEEKVLEKEVQAFDDEPTDYSGE